MLCGVRVCLKAKNGSVLHEIKVSHGFPWAEGSLFLSGKRRGIKKGNGIKHSQVTGIFLNACLGDGSNRRFINSF